MWRDIDPREEERERPDLSRGSAARSDDSASKPEVSGDALTRDLDLPRGSTRRPVRDRERTISLRESEVRMLATALRQCDERHPVSADEVGSCLHEASVAEGSQLAVSGGCVTPP